MTQYFILAAMVQLLWSGTPSASKFVLEHLSLETYIALRWTLSGLLLLALAALTQKPFPSLREVPRLAVLGIAAYALASVSGLYGLKLGGVVHFALVSSLSPLIRALLSITLLKERPAPTFWISIGMCILGLWLVTGGKMETAGGYVALGSTGAILFGYVLESLAFVYSKRWRMHHPLLVYLAILQLSAGLTMWPFAIARGPLALNQPVRVWAALLFVAVISCVICYAIYYWLLRRIEGHRLAIFDGLHSVFAAILGYWLFGESITPLAGLGGAFLIGAMVLVVRIKPAVVAPSIVEDRHAA
jgi:drug/metabolite transporter (DMT)-like permease